VDEDFDMNKPTAILLTELDAARLERSIIEQLRLSPEAQEANELEAILDAAAVVPSKAVGPRVVTMNSVVVLEEPLSGRRMTVTLVYPKDSDLEHSRVSVLSPVGRAIIGTRVGDRVQVSVPDHAARELIVVELEYQPEAAGHFDV
jgi:regulator of nucleoside diphosphate kinase